MKIVFNEAAFDALRNSPEVSRAVQAAADRIASAAGPGFEAQPVFHGKKRARASVSTTDIESRLKNAREDTLLRALGAGGG